MGNLLPIFGVILLCIIFILTVLAVPSSQLWQFAHLPPQVAAFLHKSHHVQSRRNNQQVMDLCTRASSWGVRSGGGQFCRSRHIRRRFKAAAARIFEGTAAEATQQSTGAYGMVQRRPAVQIRRLNDGFGDAAADASFLADTAAIRGCGGSNLRRNGGGGDTTIKSFEFC